MYLMLRQYRVNAERSAELIQLVEEQLVPLIRELPGFVTYYLVSTPDGTLAAIGIFHDRAGMEEADKVAEEWAGRNLETLLAFSPTNVSAAFNEVEGDIRGGALGTSEGSGPTRPKLLTVEEVQEVLGMGRSWVYQRIRSGEIPSIKLGRIFKVKQADLEAYLEKHRRQPLDEDE